MVDETVEVEDVVLGGADVALEEEVLETAEGTTETFSTVGEEDVDHIPLVAQEVIIIPGPTMVGSRTEIGCPCLMMRDKEYKIIDVTKIIS